MLKRYLNYVSTDFDPESKNRRNTANDGEEEANVQVMPSVFYKNQQPPVLELRHIMGKDVFKNPKDPSVLTRLFQYIMSSKGLFLDFFGGSGTTAHAVINANRDDRGKRKYILVEMGEYLFTVVLPRIKKVAFSDQWKDGQANDGKGISHFIKVFDFEQYEDVLRCAHYEDSDLFNNPYEDPYHRYVFLRDLKMLDSIEIDANQNKVHFHPERLYSDIDLAETLSQRRGKWIKRITAEYVEFQDGETVSLTDPDWQLIKPLVWW
jgi:adenine-specific DNA-methyltransferase